MNSNMDLVCMKKPRKGDILIFKFSCEEITLDTAYKIYDYLVEKFPDNNVIAIPKDADLLIMDDDIFEKWIVSIQTSRAAMRRA